MVVRFSHAADTHASFAHSIAVLHSNAFMCAEKENSFHSQRLLHVHGLLIPLIFSHLNRFVDIFDICTVCAGECTAIEMNML